MSTLARSGIRCVGFRQPWLVALLLGVGAFGLVSISSVRAKEPAATPGAADVVKKAKPDPLAWKDLFDGKTLTGWKTPKFGGEGEVAVKDDSIVLGLGEGITGIAWTGKPPRTNFEISLEGMRLDGNDFFATVTFPVGEKHASFVVGGWGGGTVGISSVDFYDAGDNITTRFVDFKSKQWYRVRVRVSDARVEAWVDDKQLVDLPREGHKFSTRFEIDPCQPLGVASWCTKGAVRNIRLRELKPEEIKAAAEKKE